MDKINTIIKSTIIFSIILVTSGCAMWPSLKNADQLDPDATTSTKGCLNPDLDYIKARVCAYQTLNEIDTMIDSTGEFDRGFSYVVVGLASAAGSAIGFNSSKDTLKILGVASGSLLGINQVVDTGSQRTILSRGRKQLDCVIQAADAMHESKKILDAKGATGKSDYVKGLQQPQTGALFATLTFAPTFDPYAHLSLSSQAEVRTLIEQNGDDYLGKLLIKNYLSIVSEIREQLASSANHSGLYVEQKDRISQMIGGIANKQMQINNNSQLFKAIPVQPALFTATEDTKEETKPIMDAFNNCATDAAKNIVKNNN